MVYQMVVIMANRRELWPVALRRANVVSVTQNGTNCVRVFWSSIPRLELHGNFLVDCTLNVTCTPNAAIQDQAVLILATLVVQRYILRVRQAATLGMYQKPSHLLLAVIIHQVDFGDFVNVAIALKLCEHGQQSIVQHVRLWNLTPDTLANIVPLVDDNIFEQLILSGKYNLDGIDIFLVKLEHCVA